MTGPLRILVVCTANICRSPATVTIMRRQLPASLGESPLLIESAGVAAVDGYPACDLASALVGEFVTRRYAGQPAAERLVGTGPFPDPDPPANNQQHPDSPRNVALPRDAARPHGAAPPGTAAFPELVAGATRATDREAATVRSDDRPTKPRPPQDRSADVVSGPHASRPTTAALVSRADLVLALDRTHRAELARLAPGARPRTFTLRQAARMAQSVSTSLTAGMLPPGAPPLPEDPAARFHWLVGELDATRGTVAAPWSARPGPDAPRRSLSGLEAWHDDDVPDPHVLGYQIHPMAIASLQEAASLLCDAIVTVSGYLRAGAPNTNA